MDVILAVIAALTFVKVGALEIELLSAVKGPPENYRLRLIQNLEGEAYFFMSGSKSVSAPNDMIAEIIANVESHPQFLISAIFFRVPGSQGALFSITHKRRKNLVLMEITVKGYGDRTRLILQYRAINGSTTELVFPGLSVLSNSRWHSLLIHVYSDSFDTSGIDLYIDCKKVARKQTVSPLSMIFSYRGIRLSRMEMRVGSRRENGRKKLFWKLERDFCKPPIVVSTRQLPLSNNVTLGQWENLPSRT